jgi:hypothetical protein
MSATSLEYGFAMVFNLECVVHRTQPNKMLKSWTDEPDYNDQICRHIRLDVY